MSMFRKTIQYGGTTLEYSVKALSHIFARIIEIPSAILGYKILGEFLRKFLFILGFRQCCRTCEQLLTSSERSSS